MLSYSKLITQLQTLILFSNLFFPSKLKGFFRPFWTWLYKLTILYWKPDFRPTCMLKSYTMLIKWGTFLTSKTLLFKSLINDDKVFDTCNLFLQKKSKNSTVFWAKQNGKSHQLRRWVVKCMVLPTENSNSAAKETNDTFCLFNFQSYSSRIMHAGIKPAIIGILWRLKSLNYN